MKFESQMSARELLEIERTFGVRLTVPARVRRVVEALEASDYSAQLLLPKGGA